MLCGYSAGESKVFQIELHITTATNLQTIFACNLQGKNMLRDKKGVRTVMFGGGQEERSVNLIF